MCQMLPPTSSLLFLKTALLGVEHCDSVRSSVKGGGIDMPKVMAGVTGVSQSPELVLLSYGRLSTNTHLYAAQMVVWPQQRRE